LPRTKEQFEAMRNATNEKILSAATALFSQKGVAGTGVQEIADAASISIGLLYRHYKTKDDIFGALVQKAVSGLMEIGGEFDGDPVEVIKWWAKDVLHDISKNDEFVQFMHILSPSFIVDDNFPGKKELMDANTNFQNEIAGLIERGQARNVFKEGNPVGMAQFFLTIVGGLCSMKLALKEKFILPEPRELTAFILKEEHNLYE
jgi:AcrR family transcriptional regulator